MTKKLFSVSVPLSFAEPAFSAIPQGSLKGQEARHERAPNYPACHAGAIEGIFNEDHIRMPAK